MELKKDGKAITFGIDGDGAISNVHDLRPSQRAEKQVRFENLKEDYQKEANREKSKSSAVKVEANEKSGKDAEIEDVENGRKSLGKEA